MARALLLGAILTSLALYSCSKPTPKTEARVYPAGEKAAVGPLSYTILDTQMLLRLGDDPNTARSAQNRFVLVKLAISNSGETEVPIPAMMLVDDTGQTWSELADGTGVPQWIDLVR